jgi:multidrug transporter EmrE-like cation transporter
LLRAPLTINVQLSFLYFLFVSAGKILTAAVFSVVLLKKEISYGKWRALLLLVVG